MKYLTTGYYKSDSREFAPGQIIDVPEKEGKKLLKHGHIIKVRNAMDEPPETRER
jgi:hypothetical protein